MGYRDPRDPNFLHDQAAGAQFTPGVTVPNDASPGNNGGRVPHPVNNAHVGGPAPMTAKQVKAMQQFLNNHGFQVAQDGVFGSQTKSAAQAFRTNHKGGDAWNKAHGIGVHPAARPLAGHDFHDANVGPPAREPQASGPGGVGGDDPFSTLLSALLGQGGKVGSTLDPKSFGDAAAAPQDALAAVLKRQVAQNPRQEAQSQKDISSWYGLDPNDPNYKLSVLGRQGQARERDATAATDAQSNIGDIAKSLASSVGGSANDGSGMVAAAGADAAGTMGALGEASKQYADDMAPLLAAEARGRASKEKAGNQATLADLTDKLALAAGQAKSDRAGGVATATDKNNALGQQRFANEGNLLSTLAQMQAVDPESANLKNAKLKAQIWAIQHPGAAHPPKGGVKTPKIDLGKTTSTVGNLMGLANTTVSMGQHERLATTIGSVLTSQGIKRGTPLFKQLGDQLFGTFVDEHGRPLVAPHGWAI